MKRRNYRVGNHFPHHYCTK